MGDVVSECVHTQGGLKSLIDHGGNWTRDLLFASPMLLQLSYKVKLVWVGDISDGS